MKVKARLMKALGAHACRFIGNEIDVVVPNYRINKSIISLLRTSSPQWPRVKVSSCKVYLVDIFRKQFVHFTATSAWIQTCVAPKGCTSRACAENGDITRRKSARS